MIKQSLLNTSLLFSAVLFLSAVSCFAAEKTTTIKVYGMDCQSCANGVAGSLKSLKGVKTADVSVQNAEAIVAYEDSDVTLDQLKKKIEESGYSTTPKNAGSTAQKPVPRN